MDKGTCNIYVFAKYKRGLEAISLTELAQDRGGSSPYSLTPPNTYSIKGSLHMKSKYIALVPAS